MEAIVQHTAAAWGVDQAERYVDKLIDAFERLVLSPRSAPSCGHIRIGYRRLLVERHVIYFRITDYGIAIIRILHGRMDAPSHLGR